MPAIKIEGLSKKYLIGHQKQERYTALRDVLMHKLRGIGERIRHPLSPNREVTEIEEFWALKDIDLEIEQGDRVGIIGRNGAGKSTLLKVLSRITEPTTGRIEIHGRVASLLEVGTGFHPELSGRENIYLNGAILGMTRAEIKRKFDEIVDFSGVEKFLDTPVKRYSSGMYVRLAFAVAAHLEPEILIVDEVLAVGDAEFQKKCLGKMEDVGKDGRTVLFVSHNMSAIKHLCSKAAYFEEGALLSQGDVEEQISRYLKGSRNNRLIGKRNAVNIDDKLKVERFEFTPCPVDIRNDVSFLLELKATQPVTIRSLVVLIYSAMGDRVAIIDLREKCTDYPLSPNVSLRIKGKINSVPLVEGEYSIGLFVDSGEYRGNAMDLVELIVSAPEKRANLTPFSPEVRGIVDLDYVYKVCE